jgi:hypothetical protein
LGSPEIGLVATMLRFQGFEQRLIRGRNNGMKARCFLVDRLHTLFRGLATVSFRFDPGPATRLEFDRDFAVQHANYVAHSPIW